jgi:CCR4-NOT transcriptional regulation complex NOT5 subunit
MAKRWHFIYRTTCTLTQKFYVGMHSTDDLLDGYLGSGTHIQSSVKKYGKNAHQRDILEYYPIREELAAREVEVVAAARLDPLCMNIGSGGMGSVEEHTLSTRAKISIKSRNPSPEARTKLSAGRSVQKRREAERNGFYMGS